MWFRKGGLEKVVGTGIDCLYGLDSFLTEIFDAGGFNYLDSGGCLKAIVSCNYMQVWKKIRHAQGSNARF